jgi:hypothetical protein
LTTPTGASGWRSRSQRGVSPRARPRVAAAAPERDGDAARALSGALAALRRAAGLSQPALAALAGYSVTTVGHAETGRLWQARAFWEKADLAPAAKRARARGARQRDPALGRRDSQHLLPAHRARRQHVWERQPEFPARLTGGRGSMRPAPLRPGWPSCQPRPGSGTCLDWDSAGRPCPCASFRCQP